MSNHLISTSQFHEPKDLEPFFAHADLMANPWKKADPIYMLRGKVVGLVFLENSTRTKISFKVAAKRLGCHTFDFGVQQSSIQKGESLQDTIKVLEQYSDALVIRERNHSLLETFAKTSEIPIINAGSSEHPTQAINDLYTIKKEIGKIHGTNILLMGDLKYNRAIFSLINMLKMYSHIRIHLYSPAELRLPKEFFYENIIFVEEQDLTKLLPKIDVVYITRPQKELYPEGLYEEVKNKYVFGEKELALLAKDAIIMHPLPRNNEIPRTLDSDKRAVYFRQVKNGMYIRMGILKELMRHE